ncbi:S-adenosyl-L-methionine-dependent methyltransferase [Pseudomassariella vexata]|uniref:Protein-lysine N-methyltransferase EFM4 n=1 Tax=Pseudomassariella vexata TaxID=1141098 RepID=A0A1Y2DWN4_9PEZI|nr:S-adenosyl-L-methionine-dependent methyltransferase [Pseudomassariella vexata]ORY63546.1 S-adenosyl-L-methionine-dependent methyltransferase [Pseudomassariella vexata]
MAFSNDPVPVNSDPQPLHLEPSELGTKEYWDHLYTTELSNHASDPTDTGTNWFDDSNAQDKVIEYLSTLSLPQSMTSFLDLGTGNGALLFGLRDDGWAGRMLGVDYSERSVEFARRIAVSRRMERKEEGLEEEKEDVEFRWHDILNTPPEQLFYNGTEGQWDVVLDKGTFDAISLSAETDANGRRVSEGYRGQVLKLVRDGGIFLVTSCNWTEEELGKWFEGVKEGDTEGVTEGVGFEKVGRVQYRSFSFGGVQGQTISTLCFRKMVRR